MKPRVLPSGLLAFGLITSHLLAAAPTAPNENCGVMVLSSKAAVMYSSIKLPSPHWENISLEEALVLLNRILVDTTMRSPSEVARASSLNLDQKKVRVTVAEDGDISLLEVLAIIAETNSLKITASDREIVFRPATQGK
ncbi:hypothetical protein [Verrucomicrobium sp. BvORR106]|uniref:hypothetical protein n=1 Tax=Verrucomicrobium sp. BvORR106 TaxID=1403819 RepID=UPI00056F60C4|nr:hypothetical protein [Verrucomicrobium sp. BvORR106]